LVHDKGLPEVSEKGHPKVSEFYFTAVPMAYDN
jgi:hypothetical protein